MIKLRKYDIEVDYQQNIERERERKHEIKLDISNSNFNLFVDCLSTNLFHQIPSVEQIRYIIIVWLICMLSKELQS